MLQTVDVSIHLQGDLVRTGCRVLANANLSIELAVGLERDDVRSMGVAKVVWQRACGRRLAFKCYKHIVKVRGGVIEDVEARDGVAVNIAAAKRVCHAIGHRGGIDLEGVDVCKDGNGVGRHVQRSNVINTLVASRRIELDVADLRGWEEHDVRVRSSWDVAIGRHGEISGCRIGLVDVVVSIKGLCS